MWSENIDQLLGINFFNESLLAQQLKGNNVYK